MAPFAFSLERFPDKLYDVNVITFSLFGWVMVSQNKYHPSYTYFTKIFLLSYIMNSLGMPNVKTLTPYLGKITSRASLLQTIC